MQKDYWNISKRNFRAMGIIAVLAAIVVGLGILDSANSESVRNGLVKIEIFLGIAIILFFVIASLFKKRSKKAIIVAYIYLGIAFLFSIMDFILSAPSNDLIARILGLAVLIYLFINTYKASKQKTNLN